MSSRLLVLSNGHGEDLIAQRVLQALRARRPNLEIQVLPLVGLGEAFSADAAAGHLQQIGPQLQLPSGGFSNQSLRGLARDLGAGLPLLSWRQLQLVRHSARQGSPVLAIGDLLPLLLAWSGGGSFGFIGTPKSDHTWATPAPLGWAATPLADAYHRCKGSEWDPWEWALMGSRRCRLVAVRDQLTSLGNKLALQQQVDDLVSCLEPFTLVLLGLRRIGDINKAHGYATGDLVLMEVASRLQSASVGSEAVFRVNSDKFALVIPGDSTEAAQARAREFLAQVDAPVELQELRLLASASAGTVSSPADGLAFEPLLQRAGLALAEAKKRVDAAAQPMVPFRAEMELASRLRLVLEQELRLCLDGSQFLLVIQPKVSLATGHVVGAEALIRWAHPTRGLVSPGTFLQLAREIGVMPSIDAWVLRQAIVVCQGLHSAGLQIPLSINLSGDALGDDALPERLGRQLVAAGVPASMLEVEIPEGDLMSDAQASTRTLQALHTMGVRLSIDDFGTGYSSFAYLAQFPVHTLKIDRSFVSGLDNGAENRKIVKAIVRLAHSLGLSVVGEGAETRTQMLQLRRLKCDAVQGFVVARPMKLDDFRAFVAGRPEASRPDPMSI